MPVFPPERLHALADTFLELGMVVDMVRPTLLTGLPMHYRGLLPGGIGLPPRVQLLNDLGSMNQIERLADGTVPLRVWLVNAAALARSLEQEKVFLAALDDLDHRVTGAPRLDPAALPEMKEAIVHQDDMLPFAFLEQALTASRAVTKLSVPRFENGQKKMSGANPVIYLGTGWLVAPNLLMTNHHVVNARNEGEPAATPADLQLQAEATRVQFGYDADGLAGETASVVRLEAWDAALDYAVLRIEAPGRASLVRAAGAIQKVAGDYIPVNVIQHPEGSAKKIAIRNNLVTATTATDLRYFTDTKGGSSGSPVFDDTWKVVALHRGATYAQGVSFQGRDVAFINVGTHLTSILADLGQRYPALAAEIG